ncbi:sigma-70 family RNA polymerase sigma factor, partial [Clostridium sp.]|uniref:sigma-70 family RNA polymerase sigma factor n=1 Tax=Clostridium sp. TaxID=1506 RepID=UPI0026110C23
LIKKYYPLIIKESKNVFLKDTTFEDLIQIGVLNLINAIEKYDLSKGTIYFTGYVAMAIKNGYRYLCRTEIRHNAEFSLNKTNKEGLELGLNIIDDSSYTEDIIINTLIKGVISKALEFLDEEERNLINFLYINNSKANLSKYAVITKKDYYYLTILKRRSLKKLFNILKDYY